MTKTERHGTQTIERAVVVLKALAARGNFGWRLSDLAARCELDRGTTHRIVACFIRERLARQRASDRRYLPGPLLFELGVSVPELAALQAVSHAPLARLAKRLGGIALLYLRSGFEFVCVSRAGTLQLKALTIDVGTRRPLIVSAGGLAIVAALEKEEARAVIDENLKRVGRFGEARLRALKRVIRQSQTRGYGVSEGEIVPGVSAYGTAIHDSSGEPFAAISIVGAATTFASLRTTDILENLQREGRAIARDAERGR